MDKNRVIGSAKVALGEALGDAKLQSEGQADKVEGKIQNAVGGIKAATREA